MTVRAAAVNDTAWIVGALNRRREPLVRYAPVFWRPASDASSQHRAFLDYLLTDGGAVAHRTDDSVLVAAPRGDGWLVDDVFVDQEKWMVDGRELWDAFSRDRDGSHVRFVCPAYEKARGAFALQVGLTVSASWWLKELPSSGGGDARVEVALPGARAVTVAAPPVYAPPGPILFLPVVTDAQQAVPAAVDQAPDLGCAARRGERRAGRCRLGLSAHRCRLSTPLRLLRGFDQAGLTAALATSASRHVRAFSGGADECSGWLYTAEAYGLLLLADADVGIRRGPGARRGGA